MTSCLLIALANEKIPWVTLFSVRERALFKASTETAPSYLAMSPGHQVDTLFKTSGVW